MKSPLIFVALLAFFLTTASKTFASAEDQLNNGLKVSEAWVAMIDAGQYDDSYAFGCEALHSKVTQANWVTVLNSFRAPWGTVVTRKQMSHMFKPNGFAGLNGECMVVYYDTSFKKMDSSLTEEIVLKWEGGKWRGGGYWVLPKPSDDDGSNAPPPDTTETHTELHVKPKPQ